MKENCGDLGSNYSRVPFALFFTIFALLAWQAIRPLMIDIVWAGLLSFLTAPLFKRLNSMTGGRLRGTAAGVTLILLGLLLLFPLVALLTSLGGEITALGLKISGVISKMETTETISAAGLTGSWLPKWASEYISSFLGNSEAVRAVFQKGAAWAGGLLTKISGNLIQGISSFLFHFMVTLMLSFFFIKDGRSIIEYIKSVTPLPSEEKLMFFCKAERILHSVIYGILLTVGIQAVLGGLGWWFTGLGSPVFFGALMFFFGMFPAGTAVVWVPGGLYLLLSGDIKNGVILLAWGTAIVGTIDNILRPFIISGGHGEEIPTLLVVIGLFGGVAAWGFLGIFLGPLVLVLFTLVFDIYRCRYLKSSGGGEA